MEGCPRCGGDLPPSASFCPTCGAAVTDVATHVETIRRTVTVVFCDLSGSTALGEAHDPELMRAVITRYFATVSAVFERHGGTVEKYAGDAVLAVFGVPELHEDDALRAVRAAAGARTAVAELNDDLEQTHGLRLAVRLGVETGVVAVGDGRRGTVATGDAVNVAARLEQAAAPGEVLVGPGTWRLVRDQARGEPLEPLSLPGKADGVAAWRLLEIENEQAARRLAGTPLVGRDRELALLRQTLERSVDERSCHLVTLLGTAGVGKTRLLATLLASLPTDVTVLRGRCLSYGDAVGLWPVREILRAAAGITGQDAEAQARERLAGLLPDDDETTGIVERLAPLAGLGGTPPSREETSWALRRLLESMGRQSPVVVVVDDVHWADPVLLDLLDHLADWIRDAALLLVCLSRPELLDARPTWAGGRVNTTSLLLSPLSPAATAELVAAIAGADLLAPEVADRIGEAAAGVPLYAEHLFAMLVEEGRISLVDGAWRWVGPSTGLDTPPSIAAILATRLDRLDTVSRTVLDAAAVVGEVFYRGAVTEITDTLADGQVEGALTALVRRELVRPEPSDIAGEDALRFVHVLVRDAAYDTMSKSRRAELHLRLARWLAKRRHAGVGVDAFVGHHLASAVALRDALGPRDVATRELADEGVAVLELAAAQVELADETAAAALLDRAAQIAGDPVAETRLRLRQCRLLLMDADLVGGGQAWRAARDAADRAGDSRLSELVALEGSIFAVQLPSLGARLLSDGQIESALERFRAAGDDDALIAALRAKLDRNTERATWGSSLALLDERESAARRLGDVLLETRSRVEVAGPCVWGPVPAAEALQRLDRLLVDPQLQQRDVEIGIQTARACILAMLDRVVEARAAVGWARHAADELHVDFAQETMPTGYAMVLIGDLPAAEAAFREGVAALIGQGEVAWLSTMLPMLGEVRLRLGDEDEARRCAERGRDISPPEDIESQARWRSLLARLEARRGRHEEAERLAAEGVRWITRGDQPDSIGDRHLDLAEVLAAGGQLAAARAALETAIACYRSKGDLRSERRARVVLDRL